MYFHRTLVHFCFGKCCEMPSLALANAGAHCKLCSTMNGVARWTKQSDRKIISPNSVNRPTYIRIYLSIYNYILHTNIHTHITSIPVNVSTNSAFVFAKQIQLIFRFECRFLFLLFVFLSLLIRSFACCLLARLLTSCLPFCSFSIFMLWHNCSSLYFTDVDFGVSRQCQSFCYYFPNSHTQTLKLISC